MKGQLQLLQSKIRDYLTTDFELIPKSYRDPYVIETPLQAFSQKTWLAELVFDDTTNIYYGVLQNKPHILDTVSMVEGTSFDIKYTVLDPTILTNQGMDMVDDRNLEYRWLKDDGVLHEFSNINNFKGTNTLTIPSESCTFDKTGVYKLQITNRKTGGTTTTSGLTINVLNLKEHPLLYKNLLKNGCGEQDMDSWTKESDIYTQKFGSDDNRRFLSIQPEIYKVYKGSGYQWDFKFPLWNPEAKLSQYFDILRQSIPNTTSSLKDLNPFKGWDPDAGYLKWILKSARPLIVDTDFPNSAEVGGSGGFFPSWQYIDSYNKNNNEIKLENIITKAKSYITRDKIKFAINGGKAISTAQQIIDVSNAGELIDSKVYGVTNVFAHFFAYAGIGITSYKIQFTDQFGSLVEDNMIPVKSIDYKIGMFNDKPLLPFHPRVAEYTKETTPTLWMNWENKSNPYYNSTTAATKYDTAKRDFYSRKLADPTGMTTGAGQQFQGAAGEQDYRIVITPVCADKVDFNIEFLGADQEVIASEYIPGPTEKDIWAVKEKFYMPWHIANLYGWFTNATTEKFYIYDQPYTSIDAILGVDDHSRPNKDANAEFIQKFIYPLIDNRWSFDYKGVPLVNFIKKSEIPKDTEEWLIRDIQSEYDAYVENLGLESNFLYNPENKFPKTTQIYLIKGGGRKTVPQYILPKYPNETHQEYKGFDQGAAAMFGIQQDIAIPLDTRYIRVKVNFTHTSDALNDENPKAKSWTKQTIYINPFTTTANSKQLVDYGNPRTGVTAMHLSLHPNRVDIMDDRVTYKVNLSGSVWQQELLRLENVNEYNSIVPQGYDISNLRYKYSVATLPEPPPPTNNNQITDINSVNQYYGNINLQILDSTQQLPLTLQVPEPQEIISVDQNMDIDNTIILQTDFTGVATGSAQTSSTTE